MMQLYHFRALNKEEQAKELWENGVFLSEAKVEGYKMALYALHLFYVEAKYNPATNEVMSLRSFKNTSQLDIYLKEIDLTDILSDK